MDPVIHRECVGKQSAQVVYARIASNLDAELKSKKKMNWNKFDKNNWIRVPSMRTG
jgi:hypothetical protein